MPSLLENMFLLQSGREQSVWKILCRDDVLILNSDGKKNFYTSKLSEQVPNTHREISRAASGGRMIYALRESLSFSQAHQRDLSMMSLAVKSSSCPSLIIDKLFVICSIKNFSFRFPSSFSLHAVLFFRFINYVRLGFEGNDTEQCFWQIPRAFNSSGK